MNKMTTNDYIDRFFEEKCIPEVTFEVFSENGTPNYIPNMAVVEQTKLAHPDEKEDIVHAIRQIDFKNGDVNHFLKHLAGAMAQNM